MQDEFCLTRQRHVFAVANARACNRLFFRTGYGHFIAVFYTAKIKSRTYQGPACSEYELVIGDIENKSLHYYSFSILNTANVSFAISIFLITAPSENVSSAEKSQSYP